MNTLQGKSVVITGAGSGLGAAYARHAAHLGAAVIVNDISVDAAQSTVESIVASGGRAVAHTGDISSWNYAQQLIDACIDAFGAISGIVNNAGILRIGKILDLTEADMRRMVEINLIGTAACASHAARRMLAAGKQLSFVTHPLIADPVLEGDWSYEAVTAAFAGTLAGSQQPLGLGYQRKSN